MKMIKRNEYTCLGLSINFIQCKKLYNFKVSKEILLQTNTRLSALLFFSR